MGISPIRKVTKDFNYAELVSGKLMHTINQLDNEDRVLKSFLQINENERMFLQFACTELTYKEIADKMCTSPRSVDSYRDGLF